ncbi:MAG TPA: hypothetical protein VLC74_10060 [Rhizomicrobium sp.]|nr:hypothetical protein [Rhizomicrobium sp.]
MSQHPLLSMTMRRAIPICAAAVAALGSSAAFAAHINTLKSWDGSSYVQPFGCPDTTTYGQVITVPKGETTLNKFTFEWKNLGTGSFIARGEVYAWNGTMATGSSLWESKAKTFSFSDGLFHKVTFKPGAVPVTAGQQYVVFVSIDKDYEQCTNSYEVGWGYLPSGPYTGGDFVYQNNEGNEGNWTTVPWSVFTGSDLATKMAFGP